MSQLFKRWLASAMQILTAPDVALVVGEKLTLSFDPEKAYLFSS